MENKNGIVLDGQFYEAVDNWEGCVACDIYKRCKSSPKNWRPCSLFTFSLDNRIVFKKSQSQKFSQTIINQRGDASLIVGVNHGDINIG